MVHLESKKAVFKLSTISIKLLDITVCTITGIEGGQNVGMTTNIKLNKKLLAITIISILLIRFVLGIDINFRIYIKRVFSVVFV